MCVNNAGTPGNQGYANESKVIFILHSPYQQAEQSPTMSTDDKDKRTGCSSDGDQFRKQLDAHCTAGTVHVQPNL
jgi:hypothetical protein